MSQSATAPPVRQFKTCSEQHPGVEPSRVLILTEDEQWALVAVLNVCSPHGDGEATKRLLGRFRYGDEYINPADELTRKTIMKRRLEGEIRRLNVAITRCEEQLVEEWTQDGVTGLKHAGTGASLGLTRKVWAKLDIDTDGLDRDHADQIRAKAKGEVCDVMDTLDDLRDLVRLDANLNSVSAFFREQIKAYDAEQRDLPEHERVPRDADSFLPDELRGLLKLDSTPHITVRAS